MEVYDNVLPIQQLKSYQVLCLNEKDEDIIGAYYWYLLICQTLYPFVHSLEIALRDAIHHAATKKFNSEFWFDFVVKDPKSKSILDLTKNDLQNRLVEVSAPDIVAGLTFGFWTTLMKQKTYTDQFNPHRLWPDLIPSVFPHYARGHDDRKYISARFEDIRLIRNRLFHHEPIWKFKNVQTPQECIAELRRKFNDIFKAIGWISKDKRNYLREFGFVQSFKDNCKIEILDAYKVKGAKFLGK